MGLFDTSTVQSGAGQTTPTQNPYGANPYANSTNPYITAAQQSSQGNVNAAQTATAANRVNQNTPYGSLSYQQNGVDANGNPIWSANQTLSPALQGLTDTSLAGLQSSLQNPMYGINPGQTYSDAIMSRLQPQMAQASESNNADLANQGIPVGSKAYDNAMRTFNQGQNDLQTSAIINGMNTGLQAQGLQNQTAANIKSLGNPNYVNPYQQAAVAAPDYLGAYSTANAANIAQANAQMAQSAGLTSGLFGLGSSLLQGGTGAGSTLGAIGNGVSNAYNGIVGSGGLNGLYTSMTGANPIIADTGQAAQTASNFYGSAYDPLAGWSM